jgi:hypothetical protein
VHARKRPFEITLICRLLRHVRFTGLHEARARDRPKRGGRTKLVTRRAPDYPALPSRRLICLPDDRPTDPPQILDGLNGEFATYITNNIGHIVNYGERFRVDKRISTGFLELTVNQIVDKHFDKRQSMRWTPRGAHLVLQTRTRFLNGDRGQLIRRRYPGFRTTPGYDLAPVL